MKRAALMIDQIQFAVLIDAEHDFTVDESMSIDAKDLPYAQTTAELDERWRKRVKYDILMMKLEKKSKQ